MSAGYPKALNQEGSYASKMLVRTYKYNPHRCVDGSTTQNRTCGYPFDFDANISIADLNFHRESRSPLRQYGYCQNAE